MIDSLGTGNDIVVERRFGSVLKQVKNAITDAELEIAAELDVDGSFRDRLDGRKCHLLLVDCPVTDFETLTLDGAAGVFLPLHVLVSGDANRTRIFWANIATALHGRMPVGATTPLYRLEARVAWALQGISDAAECPNKE
jgi:uncharacterized protein (DUF302 family)